MDTQQNKSILNILSRNPIFQISHAIKITYSLYIAFEIGVFNFIAQHDCVDIETISTSLGIPRRSCQALLSMCASVGLLECDSNAMYSISEHTRYFLLPESEFYLGDLINLNLLNKHVIFSYDAFKQAIITGSSQIYQGTGLFSVNERDIERTASFTKAMHAKSAAAALFWPKVLDLSNKKTFLDIGGGSGAHAIQAVHHWPHLRAIIYDLPLVCQIAEEFIIKNVLKNKITTCSGDIWTCPFPNADVHFYCDILHDWPTDKIQILIQKSYDTLPKNGQIVIHELLFNNNKSGPLDVSMCNMSMLMWTDGQQLSQQEIFNLLEIAGFRDITSTDTGFGFWNVITGTKYD